MLSRWNADTSEVAAIIKHPIPVGTFIRYRRQVPVCDRTHIGQARAVVEQGAHVGDFAHVPVGEVGQVGQARAAGEQVAHVGDLAHVPGGEVGQVGQARAVVEHGAHVGDVAHVPVLEGRCSRSSP